MRMKKLLLSLILLGLCLTMVSCNKLNYKLKPFSVKKTSYVSSLCDVDYPEKITTKTVDQKINNAINEFSGKMTKELLSSKANNIYSPISLYMALSMLLEGSSSNSFNQLANLLGTTDLNFLRSELSKIYQKNYYTNNLGVMRMANSIWIAKNTSVNQSYVEALSKYYYAESYSVDFANKDAKQKIVDWINHYTFGLLDLDTTKYEVEDDLEVLLINTIFFDNKWNKEFKTSDTYQDTFKDDDSSNVNYMRHQVSSIFYQTDTYASTSDNFSNGNSIRYFLPNEDKNIIDLISNEEILKDMFILSNKEIQYVSANISVPKFKTVSNYTLNENLKTLGVTDLFKPGVANLSKIRSENDLFVSFVKQDAVIELNESGVKAAAQTSIGMNKSAEFVGENLEFKLDQPFMYIIYDNNNIPLFIGVINNL